MYRSILSALAGILLFHGVASAEIQIGDSLEQLTFVDRSGRQQTIRDVVASGPVMVCFFMIDGGVERVGWFSQNLLELHRFYEPAGLPLIAIAGNLDQADDSYARMIECWTASGVRLYSDPEFRRMKAAGMKSLGPSSLLVIDQEVKLRGRLPLLMRGYQPDLVESVRRYGLVDPDWHFPDGGTVLLATLKASNEPNLEEYVEDFTRFCRPDLLSSSKEDEFERKRKRDEALIVLKDEVAKFDLSRPFVYPMRIFILHDYDFAENQFPLTSDFWLGFPLRRNRSVCLAFGEDKTPMDLALPLQPSEAELLSQRLPKQISQGRARPYVLGSLTLHVRGSQQVERVSDGRPILCLEITSGELEIYGENFSDFIQRIEL